MNTSKIELIPTIYNTQNNSLHKAVISVCRQKGVQSKFQNKGVGTGVRDSCGESTPTETPQAESECLEATFILYKPLKKL